MYTETKIWKNSLEPKGDSFDKARERLRQAYSGFREHVGQLIETISSDMCGLTVHNLSHLDALWEMADILTDGKYDLNPAEAFVLGGAILLHDSGMTIAAYEGGINEIKNTPEYADAFSLITIISGKIEQNRDYIEKFALSETLRIRHADKAEQLAIQKWKSPIDGSFIYLIDDAELRDHYSRTIGRIAHSHHWDVSHLPKFLDTSLGAFSGFPAEWTVDQVKVALLLRCIDAMQIDDRRAPRFLTAVREIGPESMTHWRYQNKLALPHLDDRRLVYTSKSPFSVEESTAWHLCFDTLQMIDKELRDANELHKQRNIQEFASTSIAGIGSANTLAKYIEVSGWKPLPLNLKVSDVPKLAKTLGGKDLYNNPLAPLRELIQNAADAVEARTFIENDFSIEDGLISIKFIESQDATTLELEDNGVGMSESVLTKALLDFGFSFWKSSEARKEYPGLQVNSEKFRGKYGIGFFSIFMWSSQITVSSRRFNEGKNETRVLEFRSGIDSRPILRNALDQEKSSKWSTKISMKLKKDFLNSIDIERHLHDEMMVSPYRITNPYNRTYRETNDWSQRLKLLCGALPIKVILDVNGKSSQVSLPKWRNCSVNEFTDFFGKVIFKTSSITERFTATLTSLKDEPPLGGRCFISPDISSSNIAIYDKGIFVSFASKKGISGIVMSDVTNAARDRFSSKALLPDKDWLNSVKNEAFRLCNHIGEKISLQGLLAEMDMPDPNQPIFIRNREFISLSQLKSFVLEEGSFYIRLVEDHDKQFVWKKADKIELITGLIIDERRVHPLIQFSGMLDSSSELNSILNESEHSDSLFNFLTEIKELLGPNATVKTTHQEMSGYQNDYIDITITRDTDISG